MDLIYLDRGICNDHWNQLADDASRARLRMVLGLEQTTLPAMEEQTMSESNIAAENAAEETPMAAKTTETKTKKARAKKERKPAEAKKGPKAAKAKTPKPPKPKEDREPVGNRTFAVRITDGELAAIHSAAGPRNATRFARAVLAAFAASDTKAFEAVVGEARTARG